MSENEGAGLPRPLASPRSPLRRRTQRSSVWDSDVSNAESILTHRAGLHSGFGSRSTPRLPRFSGFPVSAAVINDAPGAKIPDDPVLCREAGSRGDVVKADLDTLEPLAYGLRLSDGDTDRRCTPPVRGGSAPFALALPLAVKGVT